MSASTSSSYRATNTQTMSNTDVRQYQCLVCHKVHIDYDKHQEHIYEHYIAGDQTYCVNDFGEVILRNAEPLREEKDLLNGEEVNDEKENPPEEYVDSDDDSYVDVVNCDSPDRGFNVGGEPPRVEIDYDDESSSDEEEEEEEVERYGNIRKRRYIMDSDSSEFDNDEFDNQNEDVEEEIEEVEDEKEEVDIEKEKTENENKNRRKNKVITILSDKPDLLLLYENYQGDDDRYNSFEEVISKSKKQPKAVQNLMPWSHWKKQDSAKNIFYGYKAYNVEQEQENPDGIKRSKRLQMKAELSKDANKDDSNLYKKVYKTTRRGL
ncbi:unnamed protein product [Caenorhabditis angaria]|uniref:Uncharacterized protein n=1 Tax=Caenorhabditis angaria TaxID=860376 RepID=A0A9P1NA91_9PELO|nr:unnamed protein product [Caenorhabditis angaria]